MNELTSPTLKSTSPRCSPQKPLGALRPVDVKPKFRTARTEVNLSGSLMDVEHVEIFKAATQEDNVGKNQCYIVKVYLGQHSESTKTKPEDLERRQPDLQVVHSISQFCSLRNSVHSCVQTGHQGARCSFCRALAHFMKFGSGCAMPFAGMAFNPAGDASPLLLKFINHILQQSQLALPSHPSSGCRGQHQLPRLLHAFIFQSPRQ